MPALDARASIVNYQRWYQEGVGMDAVVAGVAAVIGGIIGGLLRPWGQDYVNRNAEERAAAREIASAERDRLRRMAEVLAMIGPEAILSTSTKEQAWREIPALSASIGDERLAEALGRMLSASSGSTTGRAAWGDASRRAGELLK